jgi:hypothetical protein
MEIPFYINQGRRCAQAAMKSVLAVRVSSNSFSLDELASLSLQEGEQMTFPCQIAYAFDKLGVKFMYFVKGEFTDSFEISRIKKSIASMHPPNELLTKINLQAIQQSSRALPSFSLVQGLSPANEFLEEEISKGRIPLCLINYDRLVGRKERFNGHYVVLTGSDEDSFYYHDNGPYLAGPNKRISKKEFSEIFGNICPFDYGLIIA